MVKNGSKKGKNSSMPKQKVVNNILGSSVLPGLGGNGMQALWQTLKLNKFQKCPKMVKNCKK